MELPALSHSMRRDFKTCPRKVYWKYVAGIKPIERATALDVGIAFQEGLKFWRYTWDEKQALAVATERLNEFFGVVGVGDEEVTNHILRVRAALSGYINRFRQDTTLPKEWLVDEKFVHRNEIVNIPAMCKVEDKWWIFVDKFSGNDDADKALLVNQDERLLNIMATGHLLNVPIHGLIYREIYKTKKKWKKKQNESDWAQELSEIYQAEEVYWECPIAFDAEKIERFIHDKAAVDHALTMSVKSLKELDQWQYNSAMCKANHIRCDFLNLCAGCNPVEVAEQYEKTNTGSLDNDATRTRLFQHDTNRSKGIECPPT